MAAGLERFLGDRAFSETCRMAAFAKAKEKYDTSVVLPQMIESYESAAEFYYGEKRVLRDTGKSTCPCHSEHSSSELVSAAPELAAVG